MIRQSTHRLALPAALVLFAVWGGVVGEAGDCERKAPPEAEKTFDAASGAFRRADVSGLIGTMPAAADAQLTLALGGSRGSACSKEQATQILNDYFAKRSIVSVVAAEGCTTGNDNALSRSYRLRTRAGQAERDSTLTVQIVRKAVDARTWVWVLAGLRETL